MKNKYGEFRKGTGSWTWQRNKAFIDSGVQDGSVWLVTDPGAIRYAGGNTYARELKYMMGRGFGWTSDSDHWVVGRVRP